MKKTQLWYIDPGKRFMDDKGREFMMINQESRHITTAEHYVIAINQISGEPTCFHQRTLVTTIGEL